MLYYRYTCVAVDWFAHGCKIESNCTIIIHSYGRPNHSLGPLLNRLCDRNLCLITNVCLAGY